MDISIWQLHKVEGITDSSDIQFQIQRTSATCVVKAQGTTAFNFYAKEKDKVDLNPHLELNAQIWGPKRKENTYFS